MAKDGQQSNILWIALIGGAIYYFWKKKQERDAQIRALAQRQGGEEVGGDPAVGGGGGGFGGGGITPLTPVITGQGDDNTPDIDIQVNTQPDPPSAIDCIKFPNTAGCQQVNAPVLAEPVKNIATQGANPSGMGVNLGGGNLGGGVTGGVTPPPPSGGSLGVTPKVTSQVASASQSAPKMNFRGGLNMGNRKVFDFDGDFDYMDKSYNKTDFDGEL